MVKRVLLVMLGLVVWSAIGLNLVAAQEVAYVGEVLLLSGQVLDVNGNPVVGAVVEIWQTDANGNYNHPNDTDPSQLVADFQYFGTSTTDENGMYSFRTIKPNVYEAMRPPHIHFKVKLDGQTLLTSQFYFEEDRPLFERDGVFTSGDNESMVLQHEEGADEGGVAVRIAAKDIVVVTPAGGAVGSLVPTPAQTEGPYYPVVDFSSYDNDLTSVGEDAPAFTLLNLNTASSEDFATIPGVGNRMVREFEEYRPYISIEQFRREIGKYVDDNQVAAYEAYIYVPINVDEADAATLMQIPGVDESTADALIAARPYGSNAAFLAKLGEFLAPAQVEFAANYLETE